MFDVPSESSTDDKCRIILAVQPVDNLPRVYGNVQLPFTYLNGMLGLQATTFCGLMDMGKPTFRRHVDAIREKAFTDQGGGLGGPPLSWLATYSIPVTFASVSSIGGGGGTQMVDYYTDRMLLNVVSRMSNSNPKKATFTNWMNDIILDYTRNGFVVDQIALRQDPNVAVRIDSRMNAHNFSQARHNMADQNVAILDLIRRCSDVFLSDGKLSNAVVSYCQQRMHNTAHVATHGMTAKQFVYSHINAKDPFLGQENFTGQYCPVEIDHNNACNYMNNRQLNIRTHGLHYVLNRLHDELDRMPPITHRQMLKMFTMFFHAPHVQFSGWDWTLYPETAIHTVVNMPDIASMKKHIYESIKTWKELYPNRKSLDHYNLALLIRAEKTLEAVCAENQDLYD